MIELLNASKAALGMIGAPELILILCIVLVIFGAGKLPQLGEALGKGIRNFKKGVAKGGEDDDELDVTPPAKQLPAEESSPVQDVEVEEVATSKTSAS